MVNLIRMGVAVGKNNRIVSSARAGIDYDARPKEQLQAWYQTVVNQLKNAPHGAEKLCLLLFGPDGVAHLVEQGKLTSHSGVRAGPSRRAEDSDEDDDRPRPSKRRRV